MFSPLINNTRLATSKNRNILPRHTGIMAPTVYCLQVACEYNLYITNLHMHVNSSLLPQNMQFNGFILYKQTVHAIHKQ